jgi:hypothetical protein
MITELKIEIEEFLRICAPVLYKLLPTFAIVALGPIAVILLYTAEVWGVSELPLASLSLSQDEDFEISAMAESRNTIPH